MRIVISRDVSMYQEEIGEATCGKSRSLQQTSPKIPAELLMGELVRRYVLQKLTSLTRTDAGERERESKEQTNIHNPRS